ncbi:MAG: STAS domain-containing protein [Dorea sp.]|jgi:anti-sigma B factor antagonist|nr:STAS domain-containing protein [Dorea sp.]
MEIKEKKQSDKIILDIAGRIDATNSSQLQSAILLAFQKMKMIELDFQKVAYIASAGLRALMIGQKTANAKGGQMLLKNVGDMVMEVFEMTGFVDILEIEE